MNAARAGALAGVTVVSGLAVLFGPLLLSVPGGLLLAFVLPGTALTQATFRPGRLDVGVVERFVLIPALSLAVLVLGGLGLWSIGGSLNRVGWLSVSVAVTLIAVGVAVFRARQAALGAARTPTRISTATAAPATGGAAWLPRISRRRLVRDILPLTLAVALLAGIGWRSYGDSDRTYDVSVTSLSAAPPGPVDGRGNRTVQVSASGLDTGAGVYRLVLTDTSGDELSEQDVTPDTDGDWTARLSVPSEDRVTMRLFRGTEKSAFRTVIIAAAQ